MTSECKPSLISFFVLIPYLLILRPDNRKPTLAFPYSLRSCFPKLLTALAASALSRNLGQRMSRIGLSCLLNPDSYGAKWRRSSWRPCWRLWRRMRVREEEDLEESWSLGERVGRTMMISWTYKWDWDAIYLAHDVIKHCKGVRKRHQV